MDLKQMSQSFIVHRIRLGRKTEFGLQVSIQMFKPRKKKCKHNSGQESRFQNLELQIGCSSWVIQSFLLWEIRQQKRGTQVFSLSVGGGKTSQNTGTSYSVGGKKKVSQRWSQIVSRLELHGHSWELELRLVLSSKMGEEECWRGLN